MFNFSLKDDDDDTDDYDDDGGGDDDKDDSISLSCVPTSPRLFFVQKAELSRN